MANGYVRTDSQRKSARSEFTVMADVQDSPVLDIGARADGNCIDIAARNYIGPQGNIRIDGDITDYQRGRVNIGGRGRCAALCFRISLSTWGLVSGIPHAVARRPC